MALFLSRFDNKVDRKGRVSVPASFRADLTSDAFAGVVAFPSPGDSRAIEGYDMGRMRQLSKGIGANNPFSEKYGDLATTILTKSHPLPFDGEGRIILPRLLLDFAGITDLATFAGRGETFQIWAPEIFDAYEVGATERAKTQAEKFELQVRDVMGEGD